MAGGLQAGKSFLDGVLSKITDPEEKAAAQRLIANNTFVTEIGNGVLGQSEIDRQLQELRAKTDDLTTQATALEDQKTALETWHQQLNSWGETNKDLIAAGKVAKAGGGAPPATPGALPAGVITQEQLDEALNRDRAAFVGYQVESSGLMKRHFETFGQILDVEPLLRHPAIREVGLKGVYEVVHRAALDLKAADAQAAHDKKIADEAVAAFRSTQSSSPYPIAGSFSPGSPLDAIKPAEGQTQVVDAAVAAFHELQRVRAGAGI